MAGFFSGLGAWLSQAVEELLIIGFIFGTWFGYSQWGMITTILNWVHRL